MIKPTSAVCTIVHSFGCIYHLLQYCLCYALILDIKAVHTRISSFPYVQAFVTCYCGAQIRSSLGCLSRSYSRRLDVPKFPLLPARVSGRHRPIQVEDQPWQRQDVQPWLTLPRCRPYGRLGGGLWVPVLSLFQTEKSIKSTTKLNQ